MTLGGPKVIERFGYTLHNGGYTEIGDTITGDVALELATSAICWTKPERMFSGYLSLLMSADTGVTWQEISIDRARRDSVAAISGVIDIDDSTFVIGARGYRLHATTQGVVDTVQGGIIRTTDGGLTWTSSAPPLYGNWIERIELFDTGIMFAWMCDMEAETDFVRFGSEKILSHGEWTLLVSRDSGLTWNTSLTVPYASKTPAQLAAWSIVNRDSATYAVTTRDNIYITSNEGQSWTEQQVDFGDTRLYAAAFDVSNRLWAATDNGIYIVDPVTKVQHDINISSDCSVHLSPNPFADHLSIRMHCNSTLYSGEPLTRFQIIDLVGNVAIDKLTNDTITASDAAEVTITMSGLPAGVYYFVASNQHHTFTKQLVYMPR